MPKGPPANYMFSPWILQSQQVKPRFKPNADAYQDITSQIIQHKFQKPKSTQDIIETKQYAFGRFIEDTKLSVASFNYTKADKLRVDSNIVLDLHDESSVLEKLDKTYDIKDGYAV